MDPNANLQEQLELAREMQAIEDASDDEGNLAQEQVDDYQLKAGRLADLMLALNEWITKGGFLPSAWERK